MIEEAEEMEKIEEKNSARDVKKRKRGKRKEI